MAVPSHNRERGDALRRKQPSIAYCWPCKRHGATEP